MALTFVGEVTLAQAAPGFAALSAAYTNALDVAAKAVLAARVSLGSLRGGLEVAVLAQVDAQLKASLAMTASLKASVSNPAVYVATQLRGAVQVTANIKAMAPTLALSTMLSARVAIDAQLAIKKAALVGLLGIIAEVSAALDAAIAAGLELVASLAAAINFAAPGILAYRYQGTLGNLGAEVSAAISGGATGSLNASTPIVTYILAADAGNVVASGALGAALGG
jgi:hypothetical protein